MLQEEKELLENLKGLKKGIFLQSIGDFTITAEISFGINKILYYVYNKNGSLLKNTSETIDDIINFIKESMDKYSNTDIERLAYEVVENNVKIALERYSCNQYDIYWTGYENFESEYDYPLTEELKLMIVNKLNERAYIQDAYWDKENLVFHLNEEYIDGLMYPEE
jgi:hypothetical protein